METSNSCRCRFQFSKNNSVIDLAVRPIGTPIGWVPRPQKPERVTINNVVQQNDRLRHCWPRGPVRVGANSNHVRTYSYPLNFHPHPAVAPAAARQCGQLPCPRVRSGPTCLAAWAVWPRRPHASTSPENATCCARETGARLWPLRERGAAKSRAPAHPASTRRRPGCASFSTLPSPSQPVQSAGSWPASVGPPSRNTLSSHAQH